MVSSSNGSMLASYVDELAQSLLNHEVKIDELESVKRSSQARIRENESAQRELEFSFRKVSNESQGAYTCARSKHFDARFVSVLLGLEEKLCGLIQQDRDFIGIITDADAAATRLEEQFDELNTSLSNERESIKTQIKTESRESQLKILELDKELQKAIAETEEAQREAESELAAQTATLTTKLENVASELEMQSDAGEGLAFDLCEKNHNAVIGFKNKDDRITGLHQDIETLKTMLVESKNSYYERLRKLSNNNSVRNDSNLQKKSLNSLKTECSNLKRKLEHVTTQRDELQQRKIAKLSYHESPTAPSYTLGGTKKVSLKKNAKKNPVPCRDPFFDMD